MNQTRFCRKVIWFKPLFPLGPDLERIFRHTKDHHQPPPSTGLPVVFVGRVRFFVSGRFFWGNLKNFIKSCLGSVIYGKGRDGWRCFLKDEVDKDGGGLPANHPKVRQSQGRPLYSPHFATWSIRLPRAMVPKSTKGLKRFQRLNHASCIIGLSFMTTELLTVPQPCSLDLDLQCQMSSAFLGHCHWRWSVKAMKRRGLSGTKSSGGADLLLPWCLVGSELCGGNRLWCQVFTAACLEGVLRTWKEPCCQWRLV